MTDFIFLEVGLVEQLHQMQIEHFGGSHGLRDRAMLDSALNRPVNKAAYGCMDACELAGAYLFGIARNHPFVDGNKRIAIVTAGVFLMENGHMLETDEAKLYAFVMAVAAGEIDEEGIVRFLKDHVVGLP
ncbi:type II toxin-antitoxin system death-on-curing family toxin [Agrobacterium larrymoorei]|uniref:Type II toxin-antitoxin system death-on-curing family toxin n=1 Tax=Agrobacterium larrymoorei TaxID=160699 RepID=A0A4D7E589_9HYPH|nr:type II toxin-antitoxin system death-on-curing family toxin [Agrobacterium larrymoorei]QCJ00331.1 type II toxin-antitoxin system death-on-curing family toxin [Agrobacterium larrymoorei]QYA09223.1 type II toxin-antitoxin system death-on-curing family toxin [Agrobacterium larrymoorei]